MKQYRPMSADVSKMSTLSAVFGLSQDQNNEKNSSGAGSTSGNGGVMLINCKFTILIELRLPRAAMK